MFTRVEVAMVLIPVELPCLVGRGDFNDIFEKLLDQLALFSIFLIYQYESDKLFCEIFLGR